MNRPRLALGLLTLAAFALRWVGIEFLLPHRLERDAELVYQARLLDGETDEVPAVRGTYPLLLTHLTRALPGGGNVPLPAAAPLQEHRVRAAADVRRARRLSAVLGCLIVPATFLLARRLVGEGWALLAAALVAFDLLHVSMSQQARPHASASALATLAMVACLRLRRAPTAGNCALAGLAIGASFGALQSGAALMLPLAAAWLLRERAPQRRVLIALGIVLAFVAACYPTTWMQLLPGGRLVQGTHVVAREEFDGSGFARMAWCLWSNQPLTLVLGAAGLLWLLARRGVPAAAEPLGRGDLAVVLAYLLPYVAVFGAYSGFDQRFALPLVPYLACLAALAVQRLHGVLAGRLPGPVPRAAAAGVLALAALAFPTFVSARLVHLRAQPDTVERAVAWMQAHLEPGADRILVMAGLDPPLFHDFDALFANGELATEANVYPMVTSWFRYQREVQRAQPRVVPSGGRWNLVWIAPWSVEMDAQGVRRKGSPRPGDYLLVERHPRERESPGGAELERALRARGELVARFSCYADGRAEGLPMEHEGPRWHARRSMTAAVLACSSAGPVVELYRLPRTGDVAGD